MAMSDEMQSAATCKEAVDLIVDRIWRACEDVGGAHGERFVVHEDVVGWVFFCILCYGDDAYCFFIKSCGGTEDDKCLCKDGVRCQTVVVVGQLRSWPFVYLSSHSQG